MLTHAISLKYRVPAAHSPMFESKEMADLDLGVVDPRMAAETISVTFLQSVLRGMQRRPPNPQYAFIRHGSSGSGICVLFGTA